MAKYRSMVIEGPAVSGPRRGQWKEWDDAGLSAPELERRLTSRESYAETFRNGNWRPASRWAVPPWELAGRIEVDGLAGAAEQLRARARIRVESVRSAETSRRAALETVKRELSEAEKVLKEAEREESSVEREAGGIDKRREAAEKALAARLSAHDATTGPAETPEAVGV